MAYEVKAEIELTNQNARNTVSEVDNVNSATSIPLLLENLFAIWLAESDGISAKFWNTYMTVVPISQLLISINNDVMFGVDNNDSKN